MAMDTIRIRQRLRAHDEIRQRRNAHGRPTDVLRWIKLAEHYFGAAS